MYRKKEKRRHKVFNYREISEYWGVNRNTVARVLRGNGLRSLGEVVEMVREMDSRYGLSLKVGGSE